MRDRIKLIVLTLIIGLSLNSCGVFKNTKKLKNIQKTEEVVNISTKENSKSDVKVSQQDIQKDVNVTITESETKETRKSPDLKVSVPRKDIKVGKEITLLDSLTGRKIIVLLDSLSDSFNIKVEGDSSVKETKNKITNISDKSKESNKDSTDNSLKQVAVTHREDKSSYTKNVDNESKVSVVGIIFMFVGLALGIFLLIWLVRKFILKR